MPLLSPPPTVRAADDLLPSARTLLDDFAARASADPAIGITCGTGCIACCHQPVPVSPAEVRSIIAALDGSGADHRARVADRAAAAVSALAANGLDPAAFAGDRDATRGASLRSFAMRLPCPLLEDGLCSVHADRPLACREYLVASDPTHCWSIDTHPEQIVHVRATTDVKSGFRHASAQLGEPDLAVLVFALAEALAGDGPPPAPPPTDPRSGPAMARQLAPPRR